MNSKLSDKQPESFSGIALGVSIAAIGAGMIWGPGGVVLALGTFIAAMSMAEYWKAA